MEEDSEALVVDYLKEVIRFAEALNGGDGGDASADSDTLHTRTTSITAESLISRLGEELLRAARPDNLRSSLPVPAAFLRDGMSGGGPRQDENDMDTEDDDENHLPFGIVPSMVRGGRPPDPTRIDALRSILRSLAPIAMDLGTRVACQVLRANRSPAGDAADGSRARLSSFVLFGLWLPMAPQLAPIVSDLFAEFQRVVGEDGNACPLALLPFVAQRMSLSSNGVDASADRVLQEEAAVVAAEAANDLLTVYCNERYETAFVKDWWDWDTCLFTLIHADNATCAGAISDNRGAIDGDGDATMSSADESNARSDGKGKLDFYVGGHSPDTTAPHCIQWQETLFQMKWHAARAAGCILSLRPLPLSNFLKRLGVYESDVPFVKHPWAVNDIEVAREYSLVNGIGSVILQDAGMGQFDCSSENTFKIPSIDDIRGAIPLHPALVHAGKGILIPRRGSVASYHEMLTRSDSSETSIPSSSFIPTDTTKKNLASLGVAMSSDPHPPPILVCGPNGSGKSSVVREMARLCSSFASNARAEQNVTSDRVNMGCQEDELLELHIDEETDSKTLLGSFVATDIPGEFVWMAGPLTSSARSGRWVLIEDIDRCPEEIQAALIRLLEERVLPLGVGKDERCHPRFRLFATYTTDVKMKSDGVTSQRLRGGGGKRILNASLWRKVHVDPLPFSELYEVGRKLHPSLPCSISDAVLDVLKKIDLSGRGSGLDESLQVEDATVPTTGQSNIFGHGTRCPSVREFIKLLNRISSSIRFEPGSDYTTENQRLICLAETVDLFAMSCPSIERRREFISQVAAPTWALTADAAMRYIEERIPVISHDMVNLHTVEVGRARLTKLKLQEDELDRSSPGKKRSFAETHHALRLMESVAVCVSQNEPALLVGETGCGKTTLVQRLANLTGRRLLVQNLSLQTDSTDLLGGYKPLEMRHVARGVYDKFVDLFVSSFSRSQNEKFLKYVLSAMEKGDWKRLAQCFVKAAGMGEKKMKELARKGKKPAHIDMWSNFRVVADRFERQRLASESGLAFLFTEGALVDAIRTGKWVLLDEINLASSETLQRLCGLLDDSQGSIILTEKGDAEAVSRHPDFRLFAAMNPATDAGKKDLPSSIRSRFTELYVDELLDSTQLRSVAARYLEGAVVTSGVPLEHTESVLSSVDLYLKCRSLSDQSLADGGGQKPRYTLRTLTRTLTSARNLILQQKFAPQRAILEGFELAFEASLDLPSRAIIQKQFKSLLPKGTSHKDRDHPGRRPDGRSGGNTFVLVKPFWIKSGEEKQIDWTDASLSPDGKPKFVLTPSASGNLRRLCQAVASGPWSVLLEGPTSAGKTTLVEYLARRCGHKCVRINNHEHTDIQEYTGSYAADSKGKISFQEGILVQALRKGYWVILDELNLAPSEVLEALNRLLDDNRELYLAEINEVVKPHENFRLFATQNPAGAYGGRKPLSRAFRNRFVEIHLSDIPEDEMVTILEKRCACPPSHAKLLVKVMKTLRQRRSRTGVFRGKDGLITPRDLLRWAGRGATSKAELALEGYFLLAERLRLDEERDAVRRVIEKELKVTIDLDETYYGENSLGRAILRNVLNQKEEILYGAGLDVNTIAPTKSIMRLLTLVMRCIEKKEPVLLVGDTGCGKTTVIQLLGVILKQQLTVVNCHASTETSDLLGGFRPVRGRQKIAEEIVDLVASFVHNWSDPVHPLQDSAPEFIVEPMSKQDLPADAPKKCYDFMRDLKQKYCRGDGHGGSESISSKRRKLEDGNASPVTTDSECPRLIEQVRRGYKQIETLYQNFSALFEWADGPLVQSMKEGHLILLDEMSLAEDAVLERLNSVLEPSRTLVLAERGGEGPECVHDSLEGGPSQVYSSQVTSHDKWRIFATMNPGGDFGKRELSPALRSRFTEIWVPSITHRSDIDLVLERSLGSTVATNRSTPCDNSIEALRKLMLDYFEWFNVDVCDDPNSFCNDFKLSLRDVLSWARFIGDVHLRGPKIDRFLAFAHGASLMHLDGLGLGTGISNIDANLTRDRAKDFILAQIATFDNGRDVVGFKDEIGAMQQSLISTDEEFGVDPFVIQRGEEVIPPNLNFDLTAPTTGLNLRRVLRGMQISKPILLEGPPGVGKTSLIAALAKASGHRLVRINLSEQTDISDLMGSDLPYSGDSEGSTSGPSFKWCDGVLLKAIKRGDWVLLDELNLASQSVLEGLNSCLDHRASVYIPELGRSFDCPPTFRVFAAQNPLAQGGGRKGLPKSFLNRFTKVYIEALTDSDLFSIVLKQFPSIPENLVRSMICFNQGVQSDIDSRLYGQTGSPWEFNLRDIFRWCELLSQTGREVSVEDTAKFADVLYTQRLRAAPDRESILARFRTHFGEGVLPTGSSPGLVVSDDLVTVGTTSLERCADETHWSIVQAMQTEPDVSEMLLRPMEAVACCVRLGWSCLLVGPTSSGKSSILNTLADACNVHIETLAMTTATDVTELIGCFEQTDSSLTLRQLATTIKVVYDGLCAHEHDGPGAMQGVHKQYWRVKKALANELTKSPVCYNNKRLIADIDVLIGMFEGVGRSVEVASISRCRQDFAAYKSSATSGSPFHWVDGTLVQAMERGSWLHLENVNYCSSSVLDRLNPLMEFGGELVLTECGLSDDSSLDAKPRVVNPHKNFRLFLSMNPSSHGEVSRAMRNRCIEVYVPAALSGENRSFGSKSDGVATIDSYTGLWNSGLRCQNVGRLMLARHQSECQLSLSMHEECPPIKSLKEWGKLFVSLLARGLSFESLATSLRIIYELKDETHEDPGALRKLPLLPLITGYSSRFGLNLNPFVANAAQGGRLLQLILSSSNDDLSSTDYWKSMSSDKSRVCCGIEKRSFRYQVICRLLDQPPMNSKYLPSLFDGYASELSCQIKMATKIAAALPTGTLRLLTLLEESTLYLRLDQLENIPAITDLSVVAVSYLIDSKRIDQNVVSCPVTPLMYPLLDEADKVIACSSEGRLGKFEMARDDLWHYLKRAQFIGSESRTQIGFDLNGFLIHYCWLKKALRTLNEINDRLRPFLLLLDTVEDSIRECTGGSISTSDVLWKRGGHPLLPSKQDNLVELQRLSDLSTRCSIARGEEFGYDALVSSSMPQVDLKSLIDSKHPCLFVDRNFSKNLLGALSMTFWASTDEIKRQRRAELGYSLSSAPQVLVKTHMNSEAAFITSLRLATVDTTIRTVDNLMDLDELRSLAPTANAEAISSGNFFNDLLVRFSGIQASQLGEMLCVSQEADIIARLSELLRPSSATGTEVVKDLKSTTARFIEMAQAHTFWQANHIRPYQTLAWLLDSVDLTAGSLHKSVRCLLPRMMYSLGEHYWCNTYNDLDTISSSLNAPSTWNKDNQSAVQQVVGDNTDMVSSFAGPSRTDFNVKRAAIFRLLQLPSNGSNSTYLSLENCHARKTQAAKLTALFACDPTTLSPGTPREDELIRFLLEAVLESFFENDVPDVMAISRETIADAFQASCENKFLKQHGTELIVPLVRHLKSSEAANKDTAEWRRHIAHAWVYLGVLRLNLLLPSSPIDPGRRPAAKVEELSRVIGVIGSDLLSHNLHWGLAFGDFDPDNIATQQLNTLASLKSTKRARQQKKIVERPSDAPPFQDLFRELHHFNRTVASLPGISSMLESFDRGERKDARFREVNWQCSASAFCSRLSTVYRMYEDVTIPCINEIRSIQRGLRALSVHQLESADAKFVIKFQDELLTYPSLVSSVKVQQLSKEIIKRTEEDLVDRYQSGRVPAKTDRLASERELQVAILNRLHSRIFARQGDLSSQDTDAVGTILDTLCACSRLSQDENTPAKDSSSNPMSEEERDENEMLEYFPNHGEEFDQIVASTLDEDDDDDGAGSIEHTKKDTTLLNNDEGLSDSQLASVVSLHRDIFSVRKKFALDDKARIRSFVRSYEAASYLSQLTEWIPESQDAPGRCIASHILALSLRCNAKRNLWTPMRYGESIRDFHHDPFPSETIKADQSLQGLLIRVGQLLTAFPGHAVLIALGQVIERVRQLDIQVVSLGKVMSGLEVILRKAQDWEQHSTKNVSLGQALKDLSSLVATWRKLELQSWPQLLTIREARRGVRAKRHFLRLYRIIHKARVECDTGESRKAQVCSPSWLWKGFPNVAKISLNTAAGSECVHELIKVLDTFILSSDLAEFWERLELVIAFANEVEHRCHVENSTLSPLGFMLKSLVDYYSRFSQFLGQTKENLREPIAAKIKDEVKIARWDEQSYYALAETSEKNHRKLLKFLRDYDEVLDTTVLSVLEKNFAEGVRSSLQAEAGEQEPTTAIPSNSSIFPMTAADPVNALPQCRMNGLLFTPRSAFDPAPTVFEWKAAGLANEVDKYVLKVGEYGQRMSSIISRKDSSSFEGAVLSSELSATVFARLESLREPKVTKQMKQRALSDLFKTLKEQGYSSMKWAVPPYVRNSKALLMLPVPSASASLSKEVLHSLEKGESYFHRCQVEISRLRLEITTFGSQYMSQREMNLMQGYSDHMLLILCQQRSMASDLIAAISTVDSQSKLFDDLSGRIPSGQAQLCGIITRFESCLIDAIENLRQLVLFLKESSALIDGNVHDYVVILSSCASKLEDNYAFCKGTMPITANQLNGVSRTAGILRDVKADISSCAVACADHFPSSVFDSTLEAVDEALETSVECLKTQQHPESNGPVDCLLLGRVATCASSLVQACLVSAQSAVRTKEERPSATAVVVCHQQSIDDWRGLRLDTIASAVQMLSLAVSDLHSMCVPDLTSDVCTRAMSSTMPMCRNILELARARLGDALLFYQQHSKLLYVLLRVFRVLVAKGFCADDVSDGGEGDGEGGAGEMKFEDDVEGTGMGEGDGKQDVTDQIENEEQLLGLKGDEKQDASSSQKELKEDEVDTGMEMEQDFEGEKYDMPDQPNPDNEEDNDDDEEELDREMGDGEDPNETVVDEKMWDDDEDDLDDMNQESEKFEADSKMTGEALDDEMRTKEDDEDEDVGGGKDQHDASKGQDDDAPPEQQDNDHENGESNEQDSEMINDDTEDKYEDKNDGVQVREEEKEHDEELGIDLNEGLNLEDELGDDDDSQAKDDEGGDISDGADESQDPANDEEEYIPASEEDKAEDGSDPECDQNETVGTGGAGVDDIEEESNPDDSPEEQNSPNLTNTPKSQHEEDLHGVAAPDGQDAVKEVNDQENPDEDAVNDGNAEDNAGGTDENINPISSKGAGGSGNEGNYQQGREENPQPSKPNEPFDDIPNPMRNPGDAEKYWHKKLDMIQDALKDGADNMEQQADNEAEEESRDKDGQFEYTKTEQETSSGQVLGVANDDQARQLEDQSDDEVDQNQQESNANERSDSPPPTSDIQMADQENRNTKPSTHEEKLAEKSTHGEDAEDSHDWPKGNEDNDGNEASLEDENSIILNTANTDMRQFRDEMDIVDDESSSFGEIQEEDAIDGITHHNLQIARQEWQSIQSETNNLSRRLCEKLRLVMEPLVATKLRGDYRTGKRVNMKRIIGYIASGYRKDKIWLRRTKPAKRDYRVLIAVDNSESMQKGHAGDVALRALATMANGMSQLEIGQLGIASFGEEMKLLHPFHIPFTSESGVNIVSNFTFDSKRTRTALCVESSIAALEKADIAASSMQLVFMISDGRIERDSRSKLRHLIRQMAEKNILMVMIIVEGEDKPSKKNESILNMKEVTFVNGKPQIKQFIEDYPFPYYLVVSDLAALPEILGDALRQWWEMLAEINS